MTSSVVIFGFIILLTAHLLPAEIQFTGEEHAQKTTASAATTGAVQPPVNPRPDTAPPSGSAEPKAVDGSPAPAGPAAPPLPCDPADKQSEACLRAQIDQFWKFKQAMKLDECYKMLTKESQGRIDLVQYIKRQNIKVSNFEIVKIEMPAGDRKYADLRVTYDLRAMGYNLKKVHSRQRWFFEDDEWKTHYQPSNPMSGSVNVKARPSADGNPAPAGVGTEPAAQADPQPGTPATGEKSANDAGKTPAASPEKAKSSGQEALLKALKLKEPPKPSFEEAMKDEKSAPPPPPKK